MYVRNYLLREDIRKFEVKNYLQLIPVIFFNKRNVLCFDVFSYLNINESL